MSISQLCKTTKKQMQANSKILLTGKYFLMAYLKSTSHSRDIGKPVNASTDNMPRNFTNNSAKLLNHFRKKKTKTQSWFWCRSKKKITFLKRWRKNENGNKKLKLRRKHRLKMPQMKVHRANLRLKERVLASVDKPSNLKAALLIMKLRKRRPRSTLKW